MNRRRKPPQYVSDLKLVFWFWMGLVVLFAGLYQLVRITDRYDIECFLKEKK